MGLAFTTAPQVTNAGSCSQALDVEARDAFDNPAAVVQDQVLALSAAPSTGITLFGAPGCTAQGSSAVLPAGSARASFSFSGTVVLETTLTASLGSLSPASQVERVNPEGFPTRLAFLTPPQVAQAGACSGVATVQAQDSLGNAAVGPSDLPLTLSASPSGMAFFADAACHVPLDDLAIPSGQTTADFYFSSTVPNPVSLTAESAGLSPASQIETVLAGPPTTIRFTSLPQQVFAAACSAPVTLHLQDAYGNPSAAAAPASVSLLAAPSTGQALFSDASCAVPAAVIAVDAGASTFSFFFKARVAGALVVSISSAGLLGDSQTETVLPTQPTQLAFATLPQSVMAGDCSGVVSVELRDAESNPSPALADTVVTLAADLAGSFALYSNAGCTAPASSLTLAAGARSGSLFFRGTLAAPVQITASAASLTPAAQSEAILPGAVDRLVFTSPPLTVTAGGCSPTLALEAQDPFGNAVSLARAVAVELQDPDAGLAFFQGGSCGSPSSTVTIDAGASAATFSFRSAVAGLHALSAGAGTWTPAVQTEQVVPAVADHLAFVTPPRSASVGACSSALTVESRDAFGNASAVGAATAVALQAAPASGFGFFSDAACGAGASSATLGAGAFRATFYFRGTVPGSVAVTAAPSGLASVQQAQAVLAADAPSQLAFATAPQRVVAGACSGAAVLESRDSFGNPLAVSADATVALAATPSTGLAFFGDAACATSVASVALAAGGKRTTFYFRATAAGSVDLAASAAGLNGASQTEPIDPAAPDRLVFSTAPQTVVAGGCSGVAAVQSRDPFGNPSAPSSAAAIALSALPAAGLTFYSDAGCTSAVSSRPWAAGATSASFSFRGTASGLVQVTAALAGLSAAAQSESVQAGPAESLAFATTASPLIAGACSQALTVEARDTWGNAAPVSAAMTASLSAAPTTFAFYADAACKTPAGSVTLAPGTSAASFWARSTAAGGAVVTAAAAGMTSAVQAETVNPAAPGLLVFTSGAQTLTAGACSSTAAVESRDAYGNASNATAATSIALVASPAAGFTFFADAGCTTAVSSLSLPTGSSSASFHFKGTAAGAVQVAASVAGWTAATQSEKVQAGPPSQLAFTTPVRALTAGACAVQAMTVEARDSFGNTSPVAAATAVALAAAPAAGFTFYPAAGCTIPASSVSIASGASSASFWAVGTAAGAVQITAAASASGWAPATQSQSVGPASPSALAFVTAAQARVAGTCSGAATVESRDSFGNASPAAALETLALAAAPAAGFTFFSDSACTAAATSLSLAAAATRASFSFRGTAAGTVQATVSRTGWAPAIQGEVITAAAPSQLAFATSPQSVPAGTCSGAATVQSRDVYGNVSAAGAATTIALAASPAAGFSFYSDAGCATSVASVPLAAATSAASFYFRGTADGRTLVTATATGWTPASQNAWMGWLADLPYRKRITVLSARVAANLTDFPVLVSLAADAGLSARARSDGHDLAFAASDGSTQLSHEIERYTSSTGALDAWVKVPSISSSADTAIYLYYGNPTSPDQQAVTDVWDLHFRGVWHLEQNPAASAPQMTDSTSNGRHGTTAGAMTASDQVAGRIGSALDLDGVEDSVVVPGLMGTPASITISGWISLRTAGTLGGEVLSVGDYIGLRLDNPYIGLSGFIYDGTTWQNTTSSQSFAGAGWHFVAFTDDSSAHVQRLYADGLQVSSTAVASPTVWSGLGSNTVFGAHGNGQAGFMFNGVLDELRFSDIARSSSWIQTEYNNQSSPSTFYILAAEQFSG